MITITTATTGPLAGDGIQTAFTVPFRFDDQTHLRVYLTSTLGVLTLQTLTTNYTVAGVGNKLGGTVTMAVPPATGETLTVRREHPLTQTYDLRNQGAWLPQNHEDEFDKITMVLQEHDERLDRALTLADGSGASGALPSPLVPLYHLAVDATGLLLEWVAPDGNIGGAGTANRLATFSTPTTITGSIVAHAASYIDVLGQIRAESRNITAVGSGYVLLSALDQTGGLEGDIIYFNAVTPAWERGVIQTLQLASGSAAAPSLSYVAFPTSGWFAAAGPELGAAVSGLQVLSITATGLAVAGLDVTGSSVGDHIENVGGVATWIAPGGGGGGVVTGSGTTNTLPLWTNGPGSVLGDSIVSESGALLTVAGAISATNQLALVSALAPQVFFTDSSAAAENGKWSIFAGDGNERFNIGLWSDDVLTYSDIMRVERTGTTVDAIQFYNGATPGTLALDITGGVTTIASLVATTADINGGSFDGGTIGTAARITGITSLTILDVLTGVSFMGATVSDGGSVSTVDINGGTVDGADIGGTVPAAGSFTTLGATGAITLSGVVNATSNLQLFQTSGANILFTYGATTSVVDFRAAGVSQFAQSATLVGGGGDIWIQGLAVDSNIWQVGAGINPFLRVTRTSATVGAVEIIASPFTASPANQNVVLSPTGTGIVTIAPATAGSMNNVVIGDTTPLAATFTTLAATTGNIQLGDVAAAQKVHVSNTSTSGSVRLRIQNSEGYGEVGTDSAGLYMWDGAGTNFFQAIGSVVNSIRCVSTGVIINDNSDAACDLRVESDTDLWNLFCDSGSNNVGIGTGAPNTSAKLEISSTVGALLVPRMTTTQRDALTATNGMIIYNTTTNQMEGYINSAWAAM